jgi:hypothetical protein
MRHLGMRHIFVDEDAFYQGGVGERAADFAIDLDKVERHVAPLQIGHSEHSIDSYLGKLLVFFAHTVTL